MHRISCFSVILLLGIVPSALVPAGKAEAKDGILAGALRWDAWFEDSPWAKELSGRQWTYRLPFFSNVGDDGKVTVNGLGNDIMDREDLYARSAGIDYFIFGLYADREADGSENPLMVNFRRSIDLFVTLRDKRGLRFSLYMDLARYARNPRIQSLAVEFVRSESFLRTGDGRPVVFVFLPKATTWVDEVGGLLAARTLRQKLQNDIFIAIGKSPYIVAMTFDPTAGAQLVASVGFEAFTSYGNPLGPRRADRKTGEQPYTRCLASSKYFWTIARQSGRPFLPPVSLGWDYRPVISDPDRGKDPEWCLAPTPEEIKDAIREADKAVPAARSSDTVRSIVIYAWNEYSEGAWLTPTLCDRASRLEAVAEARGYKEELHAALRNSPLPKVIVDCPPTERPRSAQ
jgi:hypothetical protein